MTTTCPRCGEAVVAEQDYCVECGLRLPGTDAVGTKRDPGRGWVRRSLVALVVAGAGAALAVVASGGTGGGSTILTATGGFATGPSGLTPATTGREAGKVLDWPAGQDGWTITVASLPKTGGRRAAVLRARQARRKGLRNVGVLDSSRYASLHPGYWVVFTGVYATQAEASSALQQAHAYAKVAAVHRIVP